MSSEPSTDLYRRYKIGTNHVVKWLSETATRCAGATSTVPRLETLAVSNKRTYKKRKSKPKQKPTTRSAAQITKLTSHDLLQLSHVLVASAKDTDSPPEGITDAILVLEDVVSGRKECATWYTRRTGSDDALSKQSDASHSAFVRVLLQVLAQLKSVLQKSKAGLLPAPTAQDSEPGRVLANIYQALYVEGEEHEVDTAQPDHSSSVFELEVDRAEEKAFALWCFLQECYKIRQHVKDVWIEHQARGVPAMVASQISTCATLLLSHRASRFAADYPEMDTFDRIANILDVKATLTGPNVIQFSCNEQGLASQGLSQTSMADLVCLQALTGLSVLQYHREVIDAGDDALKSWAYLTSAHPLFRSVALCMSEIQALQTENGRLAALAYGDAFTRLLIDTCVSPTRTQSPAETQLLVGLAFQMQMDILDVLGPDLSLDYLQYCVAKDDISESVQDYQAMVDQLSHASKLGTKFIKSPLRKALRRRVLTISNPPRDAEAAETWRTFGLHIGMDSSSPLLTYMPSLCGHTTWSLLQAKHADAMESINFDLALTAMVHLYQACRTVGRLPAWEDLDFVIAQHGADTFGLGKLPNHERSAFYSAKHFGLAMGVPLGKISHFRRRKPPSTSQKIPLPSFAAALEQMPKAPLSRKFLDTLRPILEGRDGLRGSPIAARAVLLQATHEVIASSGNEIDRSIQNDWLTCHTLSATQVLKVLQAGMTSEQLNMQFDRHQLMRQIYSFFDQLPSLVSSFDADLEVSSSTAATVGRMPHELVNDVLWEAAEAQSDRKPAKGLGIVGAILDGHIRAVGSANLTYAKYMLNGGLYSKEMRPSAFAGAREEDAQWYQRRYAGLTTTLHDGKLSLAVPSPTPEENAVFAQAQAMCETDPEGAVKVLAAHVQQKFKAPDEVRMAFQKMCRERARQAQENGEEHPVRHRFIPTIYWDKDP